MKTRVIFLTVISLFALANLSQAQDSSRYQMKANTNEIEANFLSSYYQQDGNNSAVTGGIGTEELSDFANVLTVNIPLDSVNAINFYGGADFYSSASIDNNISSASSHDVRGFATITYSKKNLFRNETYGIHLGFSAEYDYNSISGGASYTKEWNHGNSELNIQGQAFFDRWIIIFPIELRSDVEVPTAQRQSFNGQINYFQVLTKRLQAGISGEFIYMKGLLSTPFNRVYFANDQGVDIERLPDSRLKIPVGLRLNYFPFDRLVLRSYYRYYQDDFGITANTVELETPIKVSPFFTVAPFYRYHTQTGSDYFAPYREHLPTDEFYTSDYDLSELDSHKFGLGLRYSPLYGLLRSKPLRKNETGILMLKTLETRFGYYSRSTGLTAYFGSINLGFSFK